MDKEIYEKLVTDAAKTIFSFCRARTNSKEEAEDMSQDIVYTLLKTRENLRDTKAFYGFMWAVARNIYKDMCKSRYKKPVAELDENIPDGCLPLAELLEKELDFQLLYRELGLLTDQYRKVTIMYYFDGMKVFDISKSLCISESMVKFLLFKTRKILKEGMTMERTKGNLCFNPGNVELCVISGGDSFKIEDALSLKAVCNDSLIAQNILLACYNDRCTAEEISLHIGVAVPYLEKYINNLCEKELLVKKGSKYETAVIIFTKELLNEAYTKTLSVKYEIADIISRFLNDRLNDIKNIGFYRGNDDDELLKWLIIHVIFQETGVKYSRNLPMPQTKYAGAEAIVWGVEPFPNPPDNSIFWPFFNGADGHIWCFDFPINGAMMDAFYFDRHLNRINIIIDIAKGRNTGFGENDLIEIAEFIKHGFMERNGDELLLKLPVFTHEQFRHLKIMVDDIASVITDKAMQIANINKDIIQQYAPGLSKNEIENIYRIVFINVSDVPVKRMLDNGNLKRITNNAHPTTLVVLSNQQRV